MMPVALAEHESALKRRNHAKKVKDTSDEAAKILNLHAIGTIDADEAVRRLNELKTRHRTFLDRLIG